MSDRLKPYALVILADADDERGWCVAEYDTAEDLQRWMHVVNECGYSVAHDTWDIRCDGRITGATVVMVRKGEADGRDR